MRAQVVREFHAVTALSRDAVPSDRLLDFPVRDPSNAPAPFKRYVDVERVALPEDIAPSGAPALEVMSGQFLAAPQELSLGLLASLLFLAAGITRTGEGPDGTTRYFRAAPAGGNLHAQEVYVACGNLSGLTAGLYHFRPDLFALERLRNLDPRAAIARASADPAIAAAPVSIVITAIPWRKGWRYRERGFRHIVRDIGSMVANLLYVADAFGITHRLLVAFEDGRLARTIGVPVDTEPPIAIVQLGRGGRSEAAREELPDLALEVEPISSNPYVFPLVTEVRAAGDLSDTQAVSSWRASASAMGAPVPVIRPPKTASMSLEEVILRRGSTRLMLHESASADVLFWAMGAATQPVVSDFASIGATLLAHGVSVHAVDGAEAGRYIWSGGRLEPVARLAEADARAASQELCAGQPLGGDSAYTTYLSFNMEGVLRTLGPAWLPRRPTRVGCRARTPQPRRLRSWVRRYRTNDLRCGCSDRVQFELDEHCRLRSRRARIPFTKGRATGSSDLTRRLCAAPRTDGAPTS